MIEGKCKICGSGDLAVLAHTARCGSCGVLLYYPYPKSDGELVREGTGKEWERESVGEWYEASSFANHVNFTNMLRFAMDESFGRGKLDILDYGGGGGQFAAVCRSHFPEATVFITDISDGSLLDGWKPFNRQIPFRDFESDGNRFDFIFLNDVLEHVSDPVFVLKQLSGKLKPTGKIFIDTPRQFWIYPATKWLSKSVYGKLLKGTVSAMHLQLWSKRSFRTVVKECGLSIARYKEASEFTMPADYYIRNMGVGNPLLVLGMKLFFGCAGFLARNKILCVLAAARRDSV